MAVIRTIHNQPPDADTLGGRLSRTREAMGLSIGLVARRVGVAPKTVQEWENDRSEPGVDRLSLLAGVLSVNLVWLLHGVGDAPVDDIGPDPLLAIAAQHEKLLRMHAETGQMIERLQRELGRLADERLQS
ncbi:MAG: helix-turn-helix domain-containing protein [Mesorhizobium sp.]|nr:helix-turn-helix domain-containing protein [Mesorhizobium sp.]